MELKFVLRDEKVNIFSMIFRKQLILCKGKEFPFERPYLLDCKKSSSTFKFSEFGEKYQKRISEVEFPLKYIAYVDSLIKIKVSDKLFGTICSNRIFNIWNKSAPLKYFQEKGYEEGYLVIFRIYELKDKVNEGLLKTGREGRNFFYKLTETVEVEIKNPVLSDKEFEKEKEFIITTLKEIDCFIDSREVGRQVKLQNDDYTHWKSQLSDEDDDYVNEVNEAEPADLKGYTFKKLKTSQIESWERNPDLAKAVIIENRYRCQYDPTHLSFISKATSNNYIEAHHLIPMKSQGEFNYSLDVPGNIVPLCPNCHKRIHLGKDSERKEVLKKLYEEKKKELSESGLEISLEELNDLYDME